MGKGEDVAASVACGVPPRWECGAEMTFAGPLGQSRVNSCNEGICMRTSARGRMDHLLYWSDQSRPAGAPWVWVG
jgi:hypothetical protein